MDQQDHRCVLSCVVESDFHLGFLPHPNTQTHAIFKHILTGISLRLLESCLAKQVALSLGESLCRFGLEASSFWAMEDVETEGKTLVIYRGMGLGRK